MWQSIDDTEAIGVRVVLCCVCFVWCVVCVLGKKKGERKRGGEGEWVCFCWGK